MWHADPRVEQAQVVVDLGDGAHGGAGVLTRPLLVDTDRRAQPLDRLDIGLLHLAEELARVGGERLNVAPLSLSEDRIKGERTLPRA